MFSNSPSKMEVKEAMQQLRDHVLMEAAMVAYKFGQAQKAECEDCANAIGDAIRSMMRPIK